MNNNEFNNNHLFNYNSHFIPFNHNFYHMFNNYNLNNLNQTYHNILFKTKL